LRRRYVKDNRLDCYKAEDGHWPLTPGEYDVKLMLDDGFTEAGSHKAQSSAMTLLAACSVDKQAQWSINT
jgi:hypothetical protein